MEMPMKGKKRSKKQFPRIIFNILLTLQNEKEKEKPVVGLRIFIFFVLKWNIWWKIYSKVSKKE